MAATPGCLAAECWLSEDHQAVVTVGQWESEQAMMAGFAAVRTTGVDFDYDERESRPARSSSSSPHERLPGGNRQLRWAEVTRI